MLIQICRDYSSLPPLEILTVGNIRFFYEALRPELMGDNYVRPDDGR